MEVSPYNAIRAKLIDNIKPAFSQCSPQFREACEQALNASLRIVDEVELEYTGTIDNNCGRV